MNKVRFLIRLQVSGYIFINRIIFKLTIKQYLFLNSHIIFCGNKTSLYLHHFEAMASQSPTNYAPVL